jgi:hypothetical protein
MTPEQCRAFRIADNKVAESDWIEDILAVEIEGLKELDFDIELTGFDPADFIVPDFQPGTEDEQGQLDELQPKMVKCPHCDQLFDSRGHEQD